MKLGLKSQTGTPRLPLKKKERKCFPSFDRAVITQVEDCRTLSLRNVVEVRAQGDCFHINFTTASVTYGKKGKVFDYNNNFFVCFHSYGK